MSELLSDKLRKRRAQDSTGEGVDEQKYDFPVLDWDIKEKPPLQDRPQQSSYPSFEWNSWDDWKKSPSENRIESEPERLDNIPPKEKLETKQRTKIDGKELLALFVSFAKVGVMTFGGGYAMLPILEREIVEKRKWASEEELADYFAIGQCTPGIIAVNTATFIGRKRGGVLGGILSTLGMIFPSLIIISIIAGLIQNFADLPWVAHAFAGIRVAVCVLIFNSVLKLFQKAVIDVPTAAIFVAVLLAASLLKISPAIFVVLAALCGIAVQVIAKYPRVGRRAVKSDYDTYKEEIKTQKKPDNKGKDPSVKYRVPKRKKKDNSLERNTIIGEIFSNNESGNESKEQGGEEA